MATHDKILIVDFGSQVTQLIARRVREDKVYCEIVPYQKAAEAFAAIKPKAVILSGGPASVLDKDAPLAPPALFKAGVPMLGICYGEQVMAHQLGGKVEAGHHREFGRAEVTVTEDTPRDELRHLGAEIDDQNLVVLGRLLLRSHGRRCVAGSGGGIRRGRPGWGFGGCG